MHRRRDNEPGGTFLAGGKAALRTMDSPPPPAPHLPSSSSSSPVSSHTVRAGAGPARSLWWPRRTCPPNSSSSPRTSPPGDRVPPRPHQPHAGGNGRLWTHTGGSPVPRRSRAGPASPQQGQQRHVPTRARCAQSTRAECAAPSSGGFPPPGGCWPAGRGLAPAEHPSRPARSGCFRRPAAPRVMRLALARG